MLKYIFIFYYSIFFNKKFIFNHKIFNTLRIIIKNSRKPEKNQAHRLFNDYLSVSAEIFLEEIQNFILNTDLTHLSSQEFELNLVVTILNTNTRKRKESLFRGTPSKYANIAESFFSHEINDIYDTIRLICSIPGMEHPSFNSRKLFMILTAGNLKWKNISKNSKKISNTIFKLYKS